MTHDELKTAINKMNLAKIKTFSASRIKDLTDDFKDDLLIDIAKKARTDNEALGVIDWLNQRYLHLYPNRTLPPILKEMRKRVEFELPLTPDNTQLNEENHSLNEENRSLNTENAELNEENRSLNTENAKLNEENRSLNTENAKLNEENAKLNEENAKLNEENRSLNTENAKLLQQLKAFQSQLQGIAELKTEKASLEKLLEEEKLKNQGIEVLGAGNDEWIVELLAHLCYGDEHIARDILDEIRGKEDPVIADIIFERKQKNQISPKTQNRELWKILHAAKLYRGIEGNFNTALRRRQQR